MPQGRFALAPDGGWIAAAGGREVHVWDLTGKRVIRKKWWIIALVAAPDGSWIATADPGWARIWDVRTGLQKVAIRVAGNRLRAIAVSPDGTRLVTTCDDGTTSVWATNDGRQLSTFPAPGPIRAMALTNDNRFLATIGEDDSLSVIDLEDGRTVAVTRVDAALRNVGWDEDGIRLVASSDRAVYNFEFRNQPATKIQNV